MAEQAYAPPAGGFVPVPRKWIDALLEAHRSGAASGADVRVALALREMRARRDAEVREGKRSRFRIEEAARLTDLRPRTVAGSIRRLDASGLATFAESQIGFTVRGGRAVPIPRRILRDVAQGRGATPTVALATLARLVFISRQVPKSVGIPRSGSSFWKNRGRFRVDEIAADAGVSRRQAQRILAGFDWLLEVRSASRGKGRVVEVDPGFREPSYVTLRGEFSTTRDDTPKPHQGASDVTPNASRIRDDRARRPESSTERNSGARIPPARRTRGASSSPDLDRITAADLADPDRLGMLERAGVDRGEWTFDPTCAATEAERVLRQHRAGLVRNPGAAWRAARKRLVRWGSIRDEERAEKAALRIKGARQRRETTFDRELSFEDRRRAAIDALRASAAGGAA